MHGEVRHAREGRPRELSLRLRFAIVWRQKVKLPDGPFRAPER